MILNIDGSPGHAVSIDMAYSATLANVCGLLSGEDISMEDLYAALQTPQEDPEAVSAPGRGIEAQTAERKGRRRLG